MYSVATDINPLQLSDFKARIYPQNQPVSQHLDHIGPWHIRHSLWRMEILGDRGLCVRNIMFFWLRRDKVTPNVLPAEQILPPLLEC